MKVRWTRWATSEWLESFEHLERENASAASRTANSVLETIAMLAAHPHVGRMGRIAGTREFAVPRTPFVIGYQADLPNNLLRVLTVYDERRRWPKSFPRE